VAVAAVPWSLCDPINTIGLAQLFQPDAELGGLAQRRPPDPPLCQVDGLAMPAKPRLEAHAQIIPGTGLAAPPKVKPRAGLSDLDLDLVGAITQHVRPPRDVGAGARWPRLR